ncbi:MAG: EAL domain-containing protein [Sulfurimonas sp.]|nr:EAL domain-containing protein [Sulfurimonas sp.]
MHYQVQINAQNNSIIGVEALVRWVQSSGEIISPASFIPIAEETGLIVEIDRNSNEKSDETTLILDPK